MKLINTPIDLIFVEKLILTIFQKKIKNFELYRNSNIEKEVILNFNCTIDLIKVYYPKHYYNHLYNCNFNSIITIINHFLKEHNLKFLKKETTEKNHKVYIYYIREINANKLYILKKKIVIDLQ